MAMSETPIVPPLGEAPVTDWIRHHIARTQDWAPETTRATLAEVELAARSKMLGAFAVARGALASYWMRPGIEDAEDTHYNRESDFNDARLARLRMGHLRYGVCGVNRYDAIGSCLKRLAEYRAPDGGNLEHLVDIANLCEIEYWWPQREGARWVLGNWYAAPLADELHGAICAYQDFQDLACLATAVNLCEAEYITPTHPNAHWDAQDCGGHWSLRNSV